jgi:3D (Asp-Asp-Asp) domain-containing protein
MVSVGIIKPSTVGDSEFVETTIAEPIVIEEIEPIETIELDQLVESTTVSKETEYITFRVTAYCPCSKCCGKSDGITATGVKATQGRTIAVDPRYIPYGTEVIINGNTYVAEDCGGAIKGNRIDIYFDSHQEALAFGVQYLEGVVM